MRVPRVFPAPLLGLLTAVALTAAAAQNAARSGAGPLIPGSGPLKGETLYSNSHALLVGVNQYPHLRPEDQLECAENDAVKLREVLIRSYGFPAQNVTLLRSRQATRAAILDAITDLADADRVKPGDRVLIYFSGHGKDVPLPNGTRLGFLLPSDAKVSLGKPNPAEYLRTCLRMDEIQSILKLTPAKHAVVIADACFSGLLAGSRQAKAAPGAVEAAAVREWLARPAKQILTAGGSNEKAKEDRERGHSLFTFKLLEELTARAANPDRVFAMLEVAARLQKSVFGLSGGQQSPVFSQVDGTEGEFIFLPTAPQSVPAEGVVGPRPAVAGNGGKGQIRVTSEPAGGRIYLNGRETGQVTPATVEVELGGAAKREVELGVRQAGRKDEIRRVVVGAGPAVEVALTLGVTEPAAGQITRIELGGVPVEFAVIPGGEFLMGTDPEEVERIWQRFGWPEGRKQFTSDEAPRHRVGVDGFQMGVTEVTVGEFRAYCRATGKPLPQQEVWNNTDQHPMHNVTWDEATAYCGWATQELRRQGQQGTIRLPREAEWEYAARGGNTGLDGRARQVFVWGDDLPRGRANIGNLTDEAAKRKNTNWTIFPGYDDGYAETGPVGQFAANGYGLRDMAGNVWEWCSDYYDSDYYRKSPQINPENKSNSPYRVMRGGSWSLYPLNLRSAARYRHPPALRANDVGLRLTRAIP